MEPSARKAPLPVADPNAQLGMAWQTKGSGTFQETAIFEVDNVEIERLGIIDDQ